MRDSEPVQREVTAPRCSLSDSLRADSSPKDERRIAPNLKRRVPLAAVCPAIQRADGFSPRKSRMLFVMEARPTARRRPSADHAAPQICWPSAGKCVS